MRCAVLVLLFVLFSSSGASAVSLNVVGGQLVGASGVDVGGQLYDVEFLDGTCIALFSGCNDLLDITFNGIAEAIAASQALLDQVLADGPLGQFDTSPSLTNGCQAPSTVCQIWTPWGFPQPETVGIRSAMNNPVSDGIGQENIVRWLDLSGRDDWVYAVWTPVPEPGTALLLGFGLVGLATRRTRALALVLPFALVVIGAESASAQSSDPFQIVGVTSTSHQGGEGVRTFTLACQADYGPAARMCTTEEVLQTIVWPVIEAEAWVRPVLVSADITDVSGFGGSARNLSCNAWSDSTPGLAGITVSTTGAITDTGDVFGSSLTCDQQRRVACCKRVPEPSAALSLPIGAMGLAGLAAMKGSV